LVASTQCTALLVHHRWERMQEAGRERNPSTGMEALVVALLEPVAWRARRQALGLMQTV